MRIPVVTTPSPALTLDEAIERSKQGGWVCKRAFPSPDEAFFWDIRHGGWNSLYMTRTALKECSTAVSPDWIRGVVGAGQLSFCETLRDLLEWFLEGIEEGEK